MSTDFANKRVVVLGAGVTGNSVARYLKSQAAKVTITDDNSVDAIKPEEVDLQNFDAAVISPGWRQDHPLVLKILNSSLELLNEIDIAWNLRSLRAPGQKWIAVTGTNGKTTTVEMTAAILNAAGIKATACGNVGDTVIDALDREDASGRCQKGCRPHGKPWKSKTKRAVEDFTFYEGFGTFPT